MKYQLTTLLLCAAGAAQAGYTPISLDPSSYNADMVIEKSATSAIYAGEFTTASMDAGTNNTANAWSERGFFADDPSAGIPTAGSIITDASFSDHTWKFAPSYATNDAIMLDASGFSGLYTWTLTTPTAYTAISFLTSGGNGGCVFRWTAHHSDGTTETGTTASADWFGGSNPAVTANVRVDVQSYSENNYNSSNPRLYAKDATLTKTSPVTSIDLQYVSSASGAHTCIMAISGQTTSGGTYSPISGTGYNADIVVEAAAGPLTSGAMPLAPYLAFASATMDSGATDTGYTWYEQGYVAKYPQSGLPAAGSIITSTNLTDHQYQLASSYEGNNVIFVDSASPSATINLSTPKAYSALAFLAADGQGVATVNAIVHYQDGTSETNTVNGVDWCNKSASAFVANGRVSVTTGIIDTINSGYPALYEQQFSLTNTTSPVVSIDLVWQDSSASSSRYVVFAVSGTAGVVAPMITSQPSSVLVGQGGSTTFAVSVSGTSPFTYQWQAAGTDGIYTNLTDGNGVSGSTTATLNLTSIPLSNSGLNYQVVVKNTGGTATSSAAILTVYSSAANLAQPTDTIVAYGNNAHTGNEGVASAIDGTTQKFLHFGANNGSPFAPPAGLIWTPQTGRVKVTGVRIFTANDSSDRDPAAFTLEGSVDGGQNYTLIVSNAISLPTARNASGLDISLTNYFGECDFSNTKSYTTFRFNVTKVRTASANSTQFAEVQFLGTQDSSGAPYFVSQPVSSTVYKGDSANFDVSAMGTPTPTLQWARGTNGVYTILADTANIIGTDSSSLVINSVSYTDVADYICIAHNTYGYVTSSVANVAIVCPLTNVIYTTDLVASFGDTTTTYYGSATNAANATDGSTTKWINGGSGFSANAGFPPFAGPVGLIITNINPDDQSLRSTLVMGLRIYTADGNMERDPADYVLEGSLDGVTFTSIGSGALSLPTTRNATGSPLDPLTQAYEDIYFRSNTNSYPIYRLTFNDVRDASTAICLQVAEVQFLSGSTDDFPPATAEPATLTITMGANAKTLTITSTSTAELYSTTNLLNSVWTHEGTINGTVTVTNSSTMKFFRAISQ